MTAASNNSHRRTHTLGGKSLASIWRYSAPRLCVQYPDTSCRVELACGSDTLWSGPWTFDVRIDGVPAVPISPWDEICWVSDKDVNYLELEIKLSGGFRIQRHLVLARQDRFLLVADAVLGSRPSAIEYRGTLPLHPGTTFRKAGKTRQGTLVVGKPRATVLPLALPKLWRDQAGGELTRLSIAPGAALELRQAVHGRALFAPLFLDLDRRRFGGTTTRHGSSTNGSAMWQPLTVAESWAVQPSDVAVGYRVAIGKRQWLFYRSLARPVNRSLLGHNLNTETLVARFTRKGEVEPLIEIE